MKISRVLESIIKNSKLYLKHHSSTILTVIGSVGVVLTAISTAKATVKAFETVNEAECEKKDELTKKEIVSITAKYYIPPVLIGLSTISCIVCANVFNKKQQAALISAYALVENSFKEYKTKVKKVKDICGEEAHEKIINAIASDKAQNNPIISYYMGKKCSLMDENDECTAEPRLFYDENSGTYFEATSEKVIEAEYHLNRNYAIKGYATLNDFYELLGLEKTEYGDTLGWSPIDESSFWIEFNHRKVILEDGLQCIIIEMPFEPTEEYIEEYI